MEIFLDLDQVCVDFVSGCENFFGLKAEPKWDFFLDWGMTAEGFWEEIGQDQYFWANLPKTKEFNYLIPLISQYDPNFMILTTPTNQKSCYWGKHNWCKRHFDFEDTPKRLIYAYDKSLLSGMGRILIDDKPENIVQWESKGGFGILWPAPYNDNAGRDRIKFLGAKLAEFMNRVIGI